MDLFVLAGSGRGIGRTTISLLLAHGLAQLGLKPLHVQILGDGECPSLMEENEALFSTIALPRGQGRTTGSDILKHAVHHGEVGPVVVDLPAGAVPDDLLGDTATRVILPMSTGRSEVQDVVRDFSALWRTYSSRGVPPIVILPVGWPSIMKPNDYEPVLEREAARARQSIVPPCRLIEPLGVPGFLLRAGPLIVDGKIDLPPLMKGPVAAITRAILRATESSYIAQAILRATASSQAATDLAGEPKHGHSVDRVMSKLAGQPRGYQPDGF